MVDTLSLLIGVAKILLKEDERRLGIRKLILFTYELFNTN